MEEASTIQRTLRCPAEYIQTCRHCCPGLKASIEVQKAALVILWMVMRGIKLLIPAPNSQAKVGLVVSDDL